MQGNNIRHMIELYGDYDDFDEEPTDLASGVNDLIQQEA